MADGKILKFPKPHLSEGKGTWKNIEEMLCECADEVTIPPKGFEGGKITHAAVILVNDEGNTLFRTFDLEPDELADLACDYEWEIFQRENKRK